MHNQPEDVVFNCYVLAERAICSRSYIHQSPRYYLICYFPERRMWIRLNEGQFIWNEGGPPDVFIVKFIFLISFVTHIQM